MWLNIGIYFSITLGNMGNINKANIKRINSLLYVNEDKVCKNYFKLHLCE